jgi:hypothetical protein
MLYFPQLLSGATAQYPLLKRRVCRTIASVTAEARMLKLLDPGWSRLEWEMSLQALTTAERAELAAFHRAADGCLEEFTFLDPTENLLAWSGDPGQTLWTKEPFVSLVSGVADPEGGTEACRVTNGGALAQTLQQTIEAPGWFHYCFSLYARSQDSGVLGVYRSTGGSEAGAACSVGPAWRRLTHAGRSQGTAESVTFGIRLSPGSTVEVHGMQVEAQLAPSAYRKTMSRSGVHQEARFDNDVLTMVSDGPEQHSCKVRIVAALIG